MKTLNKGFLTFILCFFSMFTVVAQEWQHDFEIAKKVASEENKPIILVFQGSDWCAPCVLLDKEVFQTKTFNLYAKDHFVMIEADFPKKPENVLPEALKKHNYALLETYNTRGIFPFVVVLDSEGTVLGETGYFNATPSEYILHLESFKG